MPREGICRKYANVRFWDRRNDTLQTSQCGFCRPRCVSARSLRQAERDAARRAIRDKRIATRTTLLAVGDVANYVRRELWGLGLQCGSVDMDPWRLVGVPFCVQRQ